MAHNHQHICWKVNLKIDLYMAHDKTDHCNALVWYMAHFNWQSVLGTP